MSGSGLGSHGFTGPGAVVLLVPIQEDESPHLQVLRAVQSCSTDVRLGL